MGVDYNLMKKIQREVSGVMDLFTSLRFSQRKMYRSKLVCPLHEYVFM